MSAGYAAAAAALSELADRLAALGDRVDLPSPWVQVSVQPGRYGDDYAAEVAVVDTVAGALLGRRGANEWLPSGVVHRSAQSSFGPVMVSVYSALPVPAPSVPASALRSAEATWRWGAAA